MVKTFALISLSRASYNSSEWKFSPSSLLVAVLAVNGKVVISSLAFTVLEKWREKTLLKVFNHSSFAHSPRHHRRILFGYKTVIISDSAEFWVRITPKAVKENKEREWKISTWTETSHTANPPEDSILNNFVFFSSAWLLNCSVLNRTHTVSRGVMDLKKSLIQRNQRKQTVSFSFSNPPVVSRLSLDCLCVFFILRTHKFVNLYINLWTNNALISYRKHFHSSLVVIKLINIGRWGPIGQAKLSASASGGERSRPEKPLAHSISIDKCARRRFDNGRGRITYRIWWKKKWVICASHLPRVFSFHCCAFFHSVESFFCQINYMTKRVAYVRIDSLAGLLWGWRRGWWGKKKVSMAVLCWWKVCVCAGENL